MTSRWRPSAGMPSPRDERPPEIPGLMAVNEATVYPHVFRNADREVGGVLVGRIEKGAPPAITGAIPALSADERRATLTFTQAAWEHIHRSLDRDFSPTEQIVGWYHSHPGFGIFLSEHDLFIHRNFFSGPSQIALVVDPVGMTEGVFAWREGDIECFLERLTPPGWTIEPNQAPALRPRERPWADDEGPSSRDRLLALGLAGVLGLAAGLGLWQVAFKPTPETNTEIVFPNLTAPSRSTPAPAAPPQHEGGGVTTAHTNSSGG